MEFTPHLLVSIVALGMGIAFLSADRDSRTSRALALTLASIGIAIYVNIVLMARYTEAPSWSGLLGLPEAVSGIALLEWILRVRRTVPSAGLDVRFGDRVLRWGQGAGLLYAVFSIVFPVERMTLFLRAGQFPQFYLLPGFWLFAAPLLFQTFTGLISVLLLLNRRPPRAERVRLLAMMGSVPLFLVSLILPLYESAIAIVLGEMVFLVGAVHYHVLQGQQGQFMSRFLSPQVVKLVAERGLASAMQENFLELTVVCCDLRGFTAYAQAHPSSRVLQVLREYYDAVGAIVAEYGATIKDFAGDGVLILVGAPLAIPDHATKGVALARRIRDTGATLTRSWSDRKHRLGIGLGVASGQVTVGVIGSASRLEYTAVGSTVNLACRLCDEAADGEILVARPTMQLAGEQDLESRSPLAVKGFADPVENYVLAA
jgi:class 3 adenylate cyclase